MAKTLVTNIYNKGEKLAKGSSVYFLFKKKGAAYLANIFYDYDAINDAFDLAFSLDLSAIGDYDVFIPDVSFELSDPRIPEILAELNKKAPLYQYQSKALAGAVAIDFLRKYAKIRESEYSPFLIAKNYIMDNLDKQISLKDVCDECFVSPSYLVRIFNKEINMSPIEFAIKMKVETAKEELACSNKRINEIARDCGYTDEVHFSKLFKKSVGMSPKAYRDKKRSRK